MTQGIYDLTVAPSSDCVGAIDCCDVSTLPVNLSVASSSDCVGAIDCCDYSNPKYQTLYLNSAQTAYCTFPLIGIPVVVPAGAFLSFNSQASADALALAAAKSALVCVVPSVNGPIYDIKIRTDGKVYLAGRFTSVNGHTANQVARLNADGTFDTTFSVGSGFTSTYAGSAVSSLMLADDGGVYITSRLDAVFGQYTYIDYPLLAHGVIIKMLPDGSPDMAFTPIAKTLYSDFTVNSSILTNYIWVIAWTSLCQFNKLTGAFIKNINRNSNSHYLANAPGYSSSGFWEMMRPEHNEYGSIGWNSIYLRDDVTGNVVFSPNADTCCFHAIPIPPCTSFPYGGLIAQNDTTAMWSNGSPNTESISGSTGNKNYYGLIGNGSSYTTITGWDTSSGIQLNANHRAPLSFSTVNGGRWYFVPFSSMTFGGSSISAYTLIRANTACGIDGTFNPTVFDNKVWAAIEHPVLGLIVAGEFTNYIAFLST